MKRKLFWLATLGMLSQFVGHSQDLDKLATYASKIEGSKDAKCKLGMGLSSFLGNENPEISKKWLSKGDMVLVDAIASTNAEALKSELAALGMTEITTRDKIVSGYVPKNSISKLTSCTSLASVVPEFKPHTNVGLTTSQATSTLFTAEASEIFGVNGEGVKIGVISDSFNARGDADTTVATGDIPGIGNPNGFTTPVVILSEIDDLATGSDEGRGMAELIHDVAPGAELYFWSAFNGFFDFADGIRALRAAGCDVIVDDIGYFASPYFQDSAIAQAVDDVVADGAIYLSSAGNSSRESYEDTYKEIGETGFYDFGGGDFTQSISVAPGENLFLWFQWDDPSVFADPEGPFPDTDIDAFLFSAATGEQLTASQFFNIDDGYPIEIIDYTNETEEAIEVELILARFFGPAPRRIKYVSINGGPTWLEDFAGNGAGTCYGHSNAAGAIAVGAQAYVFNSEFKDAGFNGNTVTGLNGFSSYGGVEILIDGAGNDIEPIDRQKPDVVGTDFTNTTSFPNPAGPFFDLEGDGFPNFGGTSAAAPHVAAVVALLLEEKPDLTPQEVWTILDETALDMDDPITEGFDVGYDAGTGRGFVQADKALAALQGAPTVYRYQAYDATTDEFLQTLTDSSSVLLETTEDALINVVALATDGFDDAKSVQFSLSGSETVSRQENDAPFALFGDDGQGNFRNWEVSTGSYTLSTTAFDQLNTSGTSGNTYTIGFGVDYLATISSFVLVDADTNLDIGPLEETIEASLFDTYPNVTIRAEVGSPIVADATAEKVQFNLTGALQRFNEDISAPYALFGDNNGDYNSWQPEPIVGEYTIEATPFARRNGTGTAGTTGSLSFEIVDDSSPFDSIFSDSAVALDAVTKVLTVSSQSEESVSFSVYNSQGSVIFNGEATADAAAEVNLSNYGSGLFIVKSKDAETLNAKVYLQ